MFFMPLGRDDFPLRSEPSRFDDFAPGIYSPIPIHHILFRTFQLDRRVRAAYV